MVKQPSQSGFTFIEILVVIIVVGLLAALMVGNMGGSTQQRELENTARELFLLMQTASDQAVLNNAELGLILEEDGYRFVQFDDEQGAWVRERERLFAPRQWVEWLQLRPDIEDNLPRLTSAEDALKPDIVFYSSGETTAFELAMTIGNQPEPRHRLRSDGVSGIVWLQPGQEEDDLR